MQRYKHLCDETGYALIEFALIFPIFVVCVFFIIELGWHAYQRYVFDSGYMYASKEMSAVDLMDFGDIEDTVAVSQYSGSKVANVITEKMKKGSAWGFDESRLEVSMASADIKNVQESFYVPGREEKEKVEASVYTRYMTVTAQLTYQIKSLTSFGDVFHFSKQVEKTFNVNMVVAKQNRSE